uniref:Tyrosine-protein kinase receptor n=1 Tax=Gadus morhua TaxID=8049 RepID=A0A8C5FGR1_GADMO
MQDGRIKDSDITASSQWYETTGPKYARSVCCQPPLVDLGQLTFLTVVGTQGRYARSSGKEYARAYRLAYSRDGALWRAWRNRQGNPVVEANSDAYNAVIKDLHPPIITQFVRIIPVTEVSAPVCMRVELYGCPWEDGLVSYSGAEGQVMGPPGHALASLNDSIYDGTLSGGLGQLTDGVIGQDDFLLTRQYQGWPGYDYLGWRNDSLSTLGHVEMEFMFQTQRNFTSMKVHSNNMFSRGVKIFSSVSCWFKSRPLGVWGAGPVVFHTVLDDRNPSARYVTVPLGGRSASALRCRFAFADVWMMFSEVCFLSATGPSTVPPAVSPTPVLIGCLVTIILLLVLIIFLILWCQFACKVLEKVGPAPAPAPVSQSGVSERQRAAGVLLLTASPCLLASSSPPLGSSPHPGGGADLPPVVLQRDRGSADPPRAPPRPPRHRYPPPPATGCGGGYAEPDITQCTPHQCFHSNAPHYAETDVVSLQGVTGSNMYAVPALTVDSLSRQDISATEVPRERLVFREKLGEGQFGEVHLCEGEGLPGGAVLVAVKQLRADATSQARNDFLKEIKIMSRLSDPNIIQLLCVCVASDPLCMVTEYMENGDLNMFLSQREIESTLTHANNIPSVSLSDLLHMSVQISSGMRYLASLNFVHRDLASRNCLLDRRLTIKIADFGMSRNLYSSDYYRIQGRAVLPIRWMAWESILLGKFTTASDVWAFGVTLWEVFTMCKEQPYSLLSDQQVIQNTGEFFRNQGRQVLLYAPPLCPPSLFKLMMCCWGRDADQRPSFEGLYRALRPHADQ